MLGNKIVYVTNIYNFGVAHLYTGLISCLLLKNIIKNKKTSF